MLTYEETMALGRVAYGDALKALGAAGLPAVFTQTGGMCAALEVRLGSGHTLLVTDAGDTLAWERADHRGWAVGFYAPSSEHDDGPLAFAEEEDGSLGVLLPLVRRVLQARRA